MMVARVTEVQLSDDCISTSLPGQCSQRGKRNTCGLGLIQTLEPGSGRICRNPQGAVMDIPQGREQDSSQIQATTQSEAQEEARKIRRLQIMISMVTSVLSQDPNLTMEEASEMVANAKRAALAMFPDKEFAFDILYKPRLQRVIRERFRIQ